MPNYKAKTVSGESWRRCHEIHIYNSRIAIPTVRFDEEDVISLPTQDVAINAGHFKKDVDMAAEFPLLNVETGLPTGGIMSNKDLYQALYSAYIQAAKERDEKQRELEFVDAVIK